MPKKRTIADIKSDLLTPATTSHFEVEVPMPNGSLGTKLGNMLGTTQDKLNLMCSDTSLPGSSLATLELTNDRHGVTEKHPYRRIFEDRIDLTFYAIQHQQEGNYWFAQRQNQVIQSQPQSEK